MSFGVVRFYLFSCLVLAVYVTLSLSLSLFPSLFNTNSSSNTQFQFHFYSCFNSLLICFSQLHSVIYLLYLCTHTASYMSTLRYMYMYILRHLCIDICCCWCVVAMSLRLFMWWLALLNYCTNYQVCYKISLLFICTTFSVDHVPRQQANFNPSLAPQPPSHCASHSRLMSIIWLWA